MDNDEQTRQKIFELSLKRIADVFNVSIISLNLQDRFDVDLQPSFVSEFKDNEYDQINCDIQDVADKQVLKQLKSGNLVINTVEDYCEYMFNSFKRKPKDVGRVLGL